MFSNNDNFSQDLPIFISNLSSNNRNFIPFLFALQSDTDDADIVNQIIFDHGLSLQIYENNIPNQNPQKASVKALQNLLNASPMLDTDVLLKGLARNKRCVCRVEVFNEQGKMIPGTGFLVSPNQVLTNYHVIEPVLNTPELLERVKCRFDYEKSINNTEFTSGTEFQISQDNPVALSSNYSSYDDYGEPNLNIEYPKDQCDYALLNLEEKVGELPFGLNAENTFNGKERGWINLKKYDDENNRNVLILQHPEGQSQKLAIGLNKIIGFSSQKRRFRYEVNTMHGSSGAPVFNEKFELIGLHNMGDPRYIPEFNQGININTILIDLSIKNYNPTICTG
ncbi:trypsin-like serine peptidase [Aquimarina intermedia]|nr:serine protease [Aquimarina intermedia]